MHDPARVRFTGPLAPYAEGFRAELARQGYTAISATNQLRLAAHVSRWLDGRGLEAGALRPALIERFMAERRARGYRQLRSAKAMLPLLGYLRALGACPPPEPAGTPAQELLERFRAHLIGERGLAGASAAGYLDAVRGFVAGRARADGTFALGALSARDVTAFVLGESRRRHGRGAALTTTALRALLRFLHVEGLTPGPLADVVPSVASWRLAGLPRALRPEEVRALLLSADRPGPVGLRDRAILLLLARLGLRAGEVAALELGDLDWRAGEILIRGKGDRRERLPLPADVGHALAAYLRAARPPERECRRVFLRARAPRRGLSPAGVSQVVAGACARAGLAPVGAHRLRHAAACQMLRAGASLPEIGRVLRHRSPLSTAIYAKVDRDGLRSCARPWPGSAP
jgi:integrase/recombinase XerD